MAREDTVACTTHNCISNSIAPSCIYKARNNLLRAAPSGLTRFTPHSAHVGRTSTPRICAYYKSHKRLCPISYA